MRTYLQLENKNRFELPEKYREDDIRYSESLVEYFLKIYTREGDTVFDPFAGFGTTLLVAEEMGRIPYGIEFDEGQVSYIKSKLKQADNLILGDSRKLKSYDLPLINFSMTSPPYTRKYAKSNPFTAYTSKGKGYSGYLKDIRSIYGQMTHFLADDAMVVIEAANIKGPEGVTTLAWDIARMVSEVLQFEGEVIVNWDHYGGGYDHSYCLIFSNP